MARRALPNTEGKMMREFLVVKDTFWRGELFSRGIFNSLVMATET